MRIPSTTVRLGAALAAAALSLALACPAFASSSFSDVPDDEWYGANKEACIEYVAEKGFMTGYAGTDLFGPEDTLTRAQVVTALYRVITGDPDGLTSDPAAYVADDESGFSDTKGGVYYTAALNWAVSEDVARGSNGRFRPNDPVTREEFVTFMARAADFYYPSSWPFCPPIYYEWGRSFCDENELSPWAREGFEYINKYMLIEGRLFTEGPAEYRFFYPQRNATRAEAAAMLMRFNERVVYYFGIKRSFVSAWQALKDVPDRYQQDRLIVRLEREVKLSDGTLFRDYIDAVLDGGAEQPSGWSEARSCVFDLSLLAPPGEGAVDVLSSYGNVEVVKKPQDWNIYSYDVHIILHEGTTLREAVRQLMEDDRVDRPLLIEIQPSSGGGDQAASEEA